MISGILLSSAGLLPSTVWRNNRWARKIWPATEEDSWSCCRHHPHAPWEWNLRLKIYGKCRYRYSMHEAIWGTQFLHVFWMFLVCFCFLVSPLPWSEGTLRSCWISHFHLSPNKDVHALPTIHTWKMLPLAPQALNFQKMEHDKVVIANIDYFHPLPWGDDLIWLIFLQMGWFNHQQDDGFPMLETPN